jgi:broad specificity phosphatase PhoE
MLVTFLRHGQSEHNAGLTDFLDSPLTHLGKLQAEATARRFRNEGLSTENAVAFVSPLLRTLQTLEPSALLLKLPSEVFTNVCEYFSFRNDGYKSFKGLTQDEILQQFPWVTTGTRFECTQIWWPSQQETVADLYERSCRVRDQLIESFLGTGTDILIVSHADPIGRMIESFLRIPPNYDGCPWTANCGITRLQVDDALKPAHTLLLNDISHLTDTFLATPV